MGPEDQVMISYRVPETGAKSKNGDGFAVQLRDGLMAAGYTVFLDVDNLEGGDQFASVIQAAMRACTVVVVICSSSYGSAASPWTQSEFMFAKDIKKVILPVWHSGTWPSQHVGLALAGVNYIPAGRCVTTPPGVAAGEVVAELVQALLKRQIQPANAGVMKNFAQPAGGVMSWSDVRCDETARSFLRDSQISPHAAAKMVTMLGYSQPSDLLHIVAEDVQLLSLLPVEARRLQKLIDSLASAELESPHSRPSTPGTPGTPSSARSGGTSIFASATRAEDEERRMAPARAAPRHASPSVTAPAPRMATRQAPTSSPLASHYTPQFVVLDGPRGDPAGRQPRQSDSRGDKPRAAEVRDGRDDVEATRKKEQGLYQAAAQGQSQEVSRLLQLGVESTWRDANAAGCTCLQIAATNGHLSVVKVLLASGANADRPDQDGRTPLYAAARENHMDVALLLIAKSATVDQAKKDGQTPLFAAACCGHKDMATMLVAKGAKLDVASQRGETPLFSATWGGLYAVAEALVVSGANVDKPDKDGRTPLFATAYCGHTDLAKLLLTSNAKVDTTNKKGQSPLLVATWRGHNEVVKAILSHSPKTDLADEEGRTPLYAAADEGFAALAKMLLARGASVNKANKRGETPLYIAALNGQADVVKVLLAGGADVDEADKEGQTPLHAAATKGRTDVAKLLMARGAEVEVAIQAARQAKVPSHTLIRWLTRLQGETKSKWDYE